MVGVSCETDNVYREATYILTPIAEAWVDKKSASSKNHIFLVIGDFVAVQEGRIHYMIRNIYLNGKCKMLQLTPTHVQKTQTYIFSVDSILILFML